MITGMITLQFAYLMAWWRHNCVISRHEIATAGCSNIICSSRDHGQLLPRYALVRPNRLFALSQKVVQCSAFL